LKMSRPVPNPGILDIAPYTPGKSPVPEPGRKVFKLSANETPFGPSPKAMAVYREAAAQLEERRRDRRAAVLHAQAAGASVHQIAEAAGISPQRMSQIVSNLRIQRNTHIPLKEKFNMPDTFVKLHEEAGQTMAEYAVVLGVITIAVVVTLGLLSTAIQGTLTNVISSL